MIPFKDKTFCGSPHCKNECGRKMTKKEREELDRMNEDHLMCVIQGYFCGEPNEEDENKRFDKKRDPFKDCLEFSIENQLELAEEYTKVP